MEEIFMVNVLHAPYKIGVEREHTDPDKGLV